MSCSRGEKRSGGLEVQTSRFRGTWAMCSQISSRSSGGSRGKMVNVVLNFEEG